MYVCNDVIVHCDIYETVEKLVTLYQYFSISKLYSDKRCLKLSTMQFL